MASAKRQIVSGAALTTAGHALGIGASTLRNIVIARSIGPTDFGIAATFLVTLSLIDMLADLSIDKLLIQAPDGDSELLQRVAHALNAVRGVLTGLALAALAWPLAQLYQVPEAVWAYAALAAVPVIRGFAHLDMRRVQRQFRFMPTTVVDASSQIVSVLMAVALASWIGDYSVTLWVIVGQALAYTIVSHLVAERRYGWSLDRGCAQRFFVFGGPLLLNGGLIWLVTQGDRMLIGAVITTTALGIYAAANTILSVPFTAVTTIGGRVGLPMLSGRQNEPAAFDRQAELIGGAYAMVISAAFVPLVVVMPWLLMVAFGSEYAIEPMAGALLTLALTARTGRAFPTLMALSTARTGTILVGNVGRAVLLPVLIGASLLGETLTHVAGALALIEILSLGFTWYLIGKRGSRAACSMRVVVLGWLPVVMSGLAVVLVYELSLVPAMVAGAVLTVGACGLPLVISSALRRQAGMAWSRVGVVLPRRGGSGGGPAMAAEVTGASPERIV